MAYRWACNRCGQLHGRNPSRCVSCRHTVLTPVSRKTVERHGVDEPSENEYWEPSDEAEAAVGTGRQSRESEPPAAIDPDELVTYSGTPEVEYESSPDVAPDGSIGSEETSPLGEDEEPLPPRRRGYSAFFLIGSVLLLCILLLILILTL